MSTRLSGPNRRKSILEAARRLFSDNGFHGVSIDDISREVNVSPAILYRHFDSKQAIYDAVVEELSSKRESYVDTVINHGTSFEDVLQGMTRTYIRSIADNPDILRIEMQSLLDGSSATNAFFNNRWKSFTDYIEFSLNERLPYDLPNREITILSASLMYQGMIREILIQKFLQPVDRLIDVDLEELSSELVAMFLKTIGINKSKLSRKAVISQ